MNSSASPTIYFIRHGQTDWNAEVRLQGQRDIPLNAKGRLQAARNGGVLAGLLGDPQAYDFIASPLSRATETMEIVRRQLSLPERDYGTDARLREIAFGDWEGRSWTELHDDVASAAALEQRLRDPFRFRTPGNSESYADLSARIVAYYETIERDCVIVSHGGVSRVLRGHLLKLPQEEIPELKVPQDKLLRIVDGQADWL